MTKNTHVSPGPLCTVCTHPDAALINYFLCNRELSQNAIAEKFGVSPHAIGRHKRAHIPPQLRAALITDNRDIDAEKLKAQESRGLLGHVRGQRGLLWQHLQDATEVGDLRAAASLHGRLIANLDLTAKIVGEIELGERHLHIHLLASEEYRTMRRRLMDALSKFPDALAAVSDALRSVEMPEEQPTTIEGEYVGAD